MPGVASQDREHYMTVTCALDTAVSGTRVSLSGLTAGLAIISNTITVTRDLPFSGGVMWRLDGQPAAGQTGATILVDPTWDRQHITAQVGAEITAPALIQFAPPEVVGSIPAQSLTVGDDEVTLSLSNFVSGGGLTVTVEPEDGAVEVEGGVILVKATEAIDETVYIIQCQSSGGLVEVPITVSIAQAMNRVVDFPNDGPARAAFRDGLEGAIISTADLATKQITLIAWTNGNGLAGGNPGLVSLSKSDNEYIAFTGSAAQFRNGDIPTVTPQISFPDRDPYEPMLTAAGVVGTNGAATVFHFSNGEIRTAATALNVTEIATAFGRLSLGRFHGFDNNRRPGSVWDMAVTIGDPTLALQWTWNNRAQRASIGDYDFANDPDCDLIALYPLQTYLPPSAGIGITSAELNTVMTNVVTIGDPRAGGRTPIPNGGWDDNNTLQWGKQAPFEVVQRLDVLTPPSITRNGDTFTINTGVYNSAPEHTIEVSTWWNGAEVTLTGNDYTRPPAEPGQIIFQVDVINEVQKHQFIVHDNTFVPGLAEGSGDADAVTITTQRLARDGFVFFLPDGPQPMGYFGTNGCFVVGAANVRRYPLPEQLAGGGVINGSMKNVSVIGTVAAGARAGFDSRVGSDNSGNPRYDPAKNVTPPGADTVALVPGDCLIAGRSDWQGGARASERVIGLNTLHCVTAVPKWDAFRPGYSGGREPTVRYSDIDLSRLPMLDHVAAGAGAINPDATQLSSWERVSRLSLLGQSTAQRAQWWAKGHMVPYAGTGSRTADLQPFERILVSNNPPESKRAAVSAYVQQGLDSFYNLMAARARSGITGTSSFWEGDGWWNASIMTGMVVAGDLLGDEEMRNVAQINRFHELVQTFRVSQRDVDISNQPLAPFDSNGNARYSDASDPGLWYPYPRSIGNFTDRVDPYKAGMISASPMPEWGSDSGTRWHWGVNAHFTAHQYRSGAGGHDTYGEQVLLLLAMGLRAAINHEPFFEYHIRHIEIRQGRPDPWRYQGGAEPLYPQTLGTPPEGVPTGNVNTWAETMRLHHFPIETMVPW